MATTKWQQNKDERHSALSDINPDFGTIIDLHVLIGEKLHVN
ncbi:hypothetical protein [Hyunsoonleella rubra]|uniref:Uncharacterized protein n=1 Tax=Hyunsoonleella rubra TaxID=1737062 RepID=A0ABW5TDY5_9FLAO